MKRGKNYRKGKTGSSLTNLWINKKLSAIKLKPPGKASDIQRINETNFQVPEERQTDVKMAA